MINRKSFVRTWLLAAAVSTTFSATAIAADENLEAKEEQAFKQAAAVVSPSVVQIRTTGGLDQVGQILTGTGPTTGVVVSSDGFIISSSFNFISKPSTVLVNLPDGRKNLLAKVVATDNSKMLTLLKIDAKDLPVAAIEPKKSIKVGQWSIAVGRTFTLEIPSISVGIISALDRVYGRALQTDAKISPVNYGGPLVTVDGKIQGILVPLSTRGKGATAGVEWYDSGIGFAIPMEDVMRAFTRLKAGENLHPGLLGVSFKGVGLLGGDPIIDTVRSNSPAEKAGFKAGDKVVEVDGRKIVGQTSIKHALGEKYAGDKVTITVERDGKPIRKEVTLVEKLEPFDPPFLGVLPERVFGDGTAKPGVGVREVVKGSAAEKIGLKSLDRILKINGQDVSTPAQLASQVLRLRPKTKVTLDVLQGKDRKTLTAELGNFPTDVPAELTPPAMLPGQNNGIKTGRLNVTMPKNSRSYWAYVPATYNPKHRYGVMVWLHPANDTMEATIFKQWKQICDARGLLILAPKAGKLDGFTPNEAEFVKDALDDLAEDYAIDRSRVFLHSYESGVAFAFQVAFKYPEAFRGVIAAGAPLRSKPPENSVEHPQQFLFVCGDEDPNKALIARSVAGLKGMKYPVGQITLDKVGQAYPQGDQVQGLARWADSLDRF